MSAGYMHALCWGPIFRPGRGVTQKAFECGGVYASLPAEFSGSSQVDTMRDVREIFGFSDLVVGRRDYTMGRFSKKNFAKETVVPPGICFCNHESDTVEPVRIPFKEELTGSPVFWDLSDLKVFKSFNEENN